MYSFISVGTAFPLFPSILMKRKYERRKFIDISENWNLCKYFGVSLVGVFLQREADLIDESVRHGVAGQFGVALLCIFSRMQARSVLIVFTLT
jgi:uncharacterized membrane protein